jgi:hypothetical protein
MIRMYQPVAPVINRHPPMRAAAFAVWRALRTAHGALLLITGTASTKLDETQR